MLTFFFEKIYHIARKYPCSDEGGKSVSRDWTRGGAGGARGFKPWQGYVPKIGYSV